MLRSIIEFFRREAGLSILDLTTDICSSSMYYFYIRGEKNLTPKKVQALKEVLGSDQLTEEEIAQFDHEISALIDEFLGYRYSLERFNDEVQYLLDYRKQAMLEEKLVINYLILITYHAIYNHDFALAHKYFDLFTGLMPYTDNSQQIHIYLLGVILKAYPKKKMFEVLQELDYLLQHNKDIHLHGHFYRIMGDAYYALRKEKKILQYYEQALNLFQKQNNFVGIVRVLNAMAKVQIESIDNTQLIDQLMDNYKKAVQLQNGNAIFEAITNIIVAYSHLHEIDLIKTYFQSLIACIIQYSVRVIDESSLINLGVILLTNDLSELLETLEKITKGMQMVDSDSGMAKIFRAAKLPEKKDRIRFLEKALFEDNFRYCNFGVCQTLFTSVDNYYRETHFYKKQAIIKDKYINVLKEYFG